MIFSVYRGEKAALKHLQFINYENEQNDEENNGRGKRNE